MIPAMCNCGAIRPGQLVRLKSGSPTFVVCAVFEKNISPYLMRKHWVGVALCERYIAGKVPARIGRHLFQRREFFVDSLELAT